VVVWLEFGDFELMVRGAEAEVDED
jgi:hypothetical protein